MQWSAQSRCDSDDLAGGESPAKLADAASGANGHAFKTTGFDADGENHRGFFMRGGCC
jgi:hypothetical protein